MTKAFEVLAKALTDGGPYERALMYVQIWIEAEIARRVSKAIAEHAAQTATHTHVLDHDEPRIHPPPQPRQLTTEEARRLREGRFEESEAFEAFAPGSRVAAARNAVYAHGDMREKMNNMRLEIQEREAREQAEDIADLAATQTRALPAE